MKTINLLLLLCLCFAICFNFLSAAEDNKALLAEKISKSEELHNKVLKCTSYEEKQAFLNTLPDVKSFFISRPEIEMERAKLPIASQYALTALIAIGQGPNVFYGWNESLQKEENFARLMDVLNTTERFYQYIGGVIGYHLSTLQLMLDQLTNSTPADDTALQPPPCIDIRQSHSIADGLNAMESMGEIYVVGGAGDRLKLVCETTKQPLPVARLQFCGTSLLGGLVRDLEAREYLYYKLKGKQLVTPIVLMTSKEKNNDAEIAAICEEAGWFGRPKESIFHLLQPMIPVLTINGNWAIQGPADLILKPGGHGVIWKLANDNGAFDWLKRQERTFCLVRQINNPFAGLDHGLLSLAGYGFKNEKAFGFESCPRQTGLSEGMNVLCQKKQNDGSALCTISNIEYTDFSKKKQSDPHFAKIADSPDFPANTNILYANIAAVSDAANVLPIPGFLVNMKHPVDTFENGKKVTLLGARLESTMQNIADAMGQPLQPPLSKEELLQLKTFVLLNDRSRIMSVTKKAYDPAASMAETPEGCFYDLMKENSRLLRQECQMSLPEMNTPEEYLKNGPATIVLYHPALGPLYSIISQKVSKGRLATGSELQIHAAEVSLLNLDLDGSLLIHATHPVGEQTPKSHLITFSPKVGRISLENVHVHNQGIDRTLSQCYWKNSIVRKEALSIHLAEDAEFYAKDITFTGNWDIQVPKGCKATAIQEGGSVMIHVVPLGQGPSWQWIYTLDDNQKVLLHKQ